MVFGCSLLEKWLLSLAGDSVTGRLAITDGLCSSSFEATFDRESNPSLLCTFTRIVFFGF